eukprot:TRINITY_DN6304_c0_g1_i1.p1 TRINITY_DN6304_c0_g1~~TRINITY_DN6304_c0_g1_i1.p1  ORF type:complete len:443 (+),score=127.60 TRINITY_DN6304_c0_g1_i1:97-1425(+)
MPSAPAAKRPRVNASEEEAAKRPCLNASEEEAAGLQVLPEDLEKGTSVIYHGKQRGTIKEAQALIDEFWVEDASTGDFVRDGDGEIVAFKAQDLKPVERPAALPRRLREASGGAARVLLIGDEHQMVEILEHFGRPEVSERQEPTQQLLAVPCTSCECGLECAAFDPWERRMCDNERCPLQAVTADAVEKELLQLAKKTRRDLPMDVRPFHLKQAVEQVGTSLRKLADRYCLATVTLPYSLDDDMSIDEWDRRWRRQVRCQLDVGVSGESLQEADDTTLLATAKRALVASCGIEVADKLWTEEVQNRIRKELQAEDLAVSFADGPGVQVFILLLPADAESKVSNGQLHFQQAQKPQSQWTVKDWGENQELFAHLPKLPKDWIRVKSAKSGKVYYWHTKKQRPTFEFPLPDGWTQQVSKSTGKVYYFNAALGQSSFEIPTETE